MRPPGPLGLLMISAHVPERKSPATRYAPYDKTSTEISLILIVLQLYPM